MAYNSHIPGPWLVSLCGFSSALTFCRNASRWLSGTRTTLKLVIVGIGFAYAAAAFFGESAMARSVLAQRNGHVADSFLNMVRAESLFPIPYYIREGNASWFTMAQWVPLDVTKAVVDEALAQDPYSGNLLWHKTIIELRIGDMTEARDSLDRLRAVGRGWPQLENAEKVFAEVEKQIRERP